MRGSLLTPRRHARRAPQRARSPWLPRSRRKRPRARRTTATKIVDAIGRLPGFGAELRFALIAPLVAVGARLDPNRSQLGSHLLSVAEARPDCASLRDIPDKRPRLNPDRPRALRSPGETEPISRRRTIPGTCRTQNTVAFLTFLSSVFGLIEANSALTSKRR